MDQTSFNLGEAKYSGEDTNRLFIERNNVVEPKYKVLLFPYRKIALTDTEDRRSVP